MNAEREHVEKPPEADAADLPGHALPEPSGRFADDDRSRERRERAEPADQTLAIERRVVVADQQGAHYQQMPR